MDIFSDDSDDAVVEISSKPSHRKVGEKAKAPPKKQSTLKLSSRQKSPVASSEDEVYVPLSKRIAKAPSGRTKKVS